MLFSSKKITICVIIPARNRPELTADAIRSTLDQRLPRNVKLEVIIIDNRSQPSLKKLIGKKFPKIKFIRSRGYDSPGGTRNYGIRKATGDYVAFLDNDDQWKPDFLIKSLKTIQATKTPATVCLTAPFFDGPYPLIEKLKLIFLNLIRTFVFIVIWILNHQKLPPSGFYLCQISHILFDKKAIKNTKFNETAVAAEDWEFMVDVTKNKPTSIILKPLVKFRYSWSSNTNSDQVRAKKWQAYQNLINRLPASYKQGILHRLFHLYIRSFGH